MSRSSCRNLSIAIVLSAALTTMAFGMSPDQAFRIYGILREDPYQPGTVLQQRLYRIVRPYVGRVRYRWGGTSVSQGMDCSAFARFVMQKLGVRLPRTVREQAQIGKRVPASGLRPGDLVFFDASRNRKGPDHVGIYLGSGRFVHSYKGGGVTIHSTATWEYPIILGTRVIL